MSWTCLIIGVSWKRKSIMDTQQNSTPLTAFHEAIRALICSEEPNEPKPEAINRTLMFIVNFEKALGPRYKIGADGCSIEPALTPKTDQKYYNLLIYKTVRRFLISPRYSSKKNLICDVEMAIYDLENS